MSVKSWKEVESRILEIHFNEQFDLIVAIANGGVIPAALINQRLMLPVELLKLSFRDARQKPLYATPQLLESMTFDATGKTILLVEDRVKTGATLQMAKSLLNTAATVKTFAVNGKADYSLFDEVCFKFPWIMETGVAIKAP